MSKNEVYRPLSADDMENSATEVESLCINCEQMGVTRLLLTKIPFYKEVILMSFSCDHCGYRNNEIQSGTKVQEQGLRYIVKIKTKQDLNRQVVKSKYASVLIPEVDFEIPSCSQPGEITTIEGIIKRAADALRQDQDHRKATNLTYADMIEKFVAKLEGLLSMEVEFTLIVDDPSGDSFIENPNPYQVDPNAKIIHYHRNLQQDKMLALVADDVEEEDNQEAPPVWESKDALRNEVLHFAVDCPNCKAPAQTNMKLMSELI